MATVTYDPNKDYSTAIEAAKKAGQSTAQLEAERAAKIADMYGGKEPTYNGTNQTYSQYSAAQSSASKPATASSSTGGSSGSSSSSSATSQLQNAVSSGITKASGGSYNGIPLQNTTGTVKDSITHDYSRKPELAGQVVIQNNKALYYDDNGYMTKAVALGSNSPAAAQAVKDLNDRGVYTGAQQTWANVTGNDVSASYGQTGQDIASLYEAYKQNTSPVSGAGTAAISSGGTVQAGQSSTPSGSASSGVYNSNVDYSDLLNDAINSGASWQEVQSILNQRNAKINSNPNLSQYLYDENYARAMQYIYTKQQNEAQLEANIAALKGAYDQSVSDYTAAKDKITPQYQAERNQTAASSDVNWNQFAQVAAANGLNTGAIGQAALSRAVTQQNNMNALNQSEAEDLSDIDLEISKLQAEFNSAIAQAQANGNAELAAALYDQFNNYVAQKQQAQANKLAAQQAAAEAEQARQAEAYNLVVDLITSGLMPTDTQLAAAGMTKADAQYLYNQIIADKLNGGSSGGSGGSKSSSSSSGGGSGSAGSVSTTTTAAKTNYKPATDLNTGLNNIASANAGGDTENYAAVSRELLNMRRSGSSDKTMADYLEKQIDNGVVTENQAYQLVNTYGINLNAQNGTKTETSKTTIDLSAFPQPIYTQKK